jgi:uncharacterized protein (UPF0297 family)
MNHKTFAKKTVAHVFGQADKKKFGRAPIEEVVKYAFLAGACEAMLDIVKAHNEDREMEKDILLGEIQNIYLKYGNELVRRNFPTMNQLTIEDLMKHMGFE